MKLFLGAVAALMSPCPAVAAIIDFENFAVGETISGKFGGPIPFIELSGKIVEINGDKFLETNLITPTNQNLPGLPRRKQGYTIDSFDVFAGGNGQLYYTNPGVGRIELNFLADQVTTLNLNYAESGTSTLRLTNIGYRVYVDDISYSTSVISVPEPSTWAMLLLGFSLIGAAARRQQRFAITKAGYSTTCLV